MSENRGGFFDSHCRIYNIEQFVPFDVN